MTVSHEITLVAISAKWVLMDDGQVVAITHMHGPDGCDCEAGQAAVVVAGPCRDRLWYTIPLDEAPVQKFQQ